MVYVIREIKLYITMRYLILLQLNLDTDSSRVGEIVEQQELSSVAVGNAKSYNHFGGF